MSKFGDFLVRIFLYLDWMSKFTEKISMFSRNTGKHGSEKNSKFGHFSCSIYKTLLLISSKLSLNKIIPGIKLSINIAARICTEFLSKMFDWPIKCQCCPHKETSQLICIASQLTGFYMRATLALNGLKLHWQVVVYWYLILTLSSPVIHS